MKKELIVKQVDYFMVEFPLLFIRPQGISASGDMKANINIMLTNCRLESSHKASL